jgi:hypothetical protein
MSLEKAVDKDPVSGGFKTETKGGAAECVER